MTETRFAEIHNAIVNAISQDVQLVEDFDDSDPLGLSFYVYALQKTGYTNLILDALPDAGRFWVEETITEGLNTPYLDRDLAAIGMVVFSLCQHSTCPEISAEDFISLVEPHFNDSKGLFGNFLCTVLVGLSLMMLDPQSALFEGFAAYIDTQIKSQGQSIFNDPKNFVIAHLWATQTQSQSILETLIIDCKKYAIDQVRSPRDLVYLSYVLLEEVEQIHRTERGKVQQFVEDSLKFVQTQSAESVFAPYITEEYSYDVTTRPHTLEQLGHRTRPRLSRIMLSIGLILERQYATKWRLFFSRQARLEITIRGLAYGLLSLIAAGLFYWLTRLIDIPFSLQTDLASKDFLTIIGVFVVKLPLNIFWAAILALFLIAAFMFFYQLSLTGRRKSELEVIADIWSFLKKYWPVEIGLGVILLVLDAVLS